MARNISIYPSPALDAACALNGGGRNRSHRISQIADRYAEIMRRTALPDFTEAEWSLLQDACNGVLHEPAGMIRGGLALGVEDAIALDGLADKWSVDGAALLARLRDLAFAQEVRLIEDIERRWGEQADATAP